MTTVTPPTAPTLFLVDGYALIYRAFFALLSRPLRTAKGENTSAAWGVVNFLQRLVDKHKPDYIAWVHDAGSSFRKEMLPTYKATRDKLTAELQADFDQGLERISELLAAFRVRIVAIEGYEADDVIGTLARQAVAQGTHVAIVSGDKDFQQLVSPGIWLLNPGRGGPAAVDEQWVSTDNGSERLGIAPEHVTDYLALLGDSSDNVPGVPGVGEKTAQELVNQFGTLENILSHATEVTKKRPREALLAFGDQARLSKRLVTIHNDVPVTLDLPAFARQPVDSSRLRQLYSELEFSSLIDKLPASGSRQESTTVGPGLKATIVSSLSTLEALCELVRKSGTATLSVESAPAGGDPQRARLVAMALSTGPGEAYYLPFAHARWAPPQGDLALGGLASSSAPSPGGESLAAQALASAMDRRPDNLPSVASHDMRALRALLEDPSVHKVGHNLKQALLLLKTEGVALRGIAFDTMLASYVLDPGRRDHSLQVLAIEFLDVALPNQEQLRGKGKTEISFEHVPVSVAADFLGVYVDTARRLHEKMAPLLAESKAEPLLRDVELPLLSVLADMEWVGIGIDTTWFRSLKTRFQAERERVEGEIYEVAGERFNINSNPQLRAILFDKLDLPIKKKTATGPSTDASVLQELADEGHALPALLMEYRELAKLESTYLDTLPALIHPRDGRLHTSFNQTVAATGRLSSSDPNLQNIPVRRELGKDIRRGFVAAAHSVLIAADYSQIELRLLAHLSQDPAFIHAFQSGGDIHRETAAIIFGVPVESVTPEMRARAKTINFATIYGQGAHALSRQLKIPNAEAKEFIATYFERFRGVRSYLDSMVAFARDHGYVETIFHRRRYIPELKERNFNMRAFGERVATNAPIQGSAADLIKIAMIRIHTRLTSEFPAARMLLQVHDELVFEAPCELAPRVEALVTGEMESAASLSVPLVVDVGRGANWVEAKH